jgi:hypothetical protein
MHLKLLEKEQTNPKSSRQKLQKSEQKQWIGDQKSDTMDRWNKKLVFWKNKIVSQINQKKKGENPN